MPSRNRQRCSVCRDDGKRERDRGIATSIFTRRATSGEILSRTYVCDACLPAFKEKVAAEEEMARITGGAKP